MKTIDVNNWTKQQNWYGNPSLGFNCWLKTFRNPFNGRKTPVFVFGLPDSEELSFVVSAGANSDFSYCGCFFPQKLNWSETMAAIDEKYVKGQLFK